MKKIYALLLLAAIYTSPVFAQKDTESRIDSLEKTFKYQHGTVSLGKGIATIVVPPGFKYLDSVQAEMVLTKLWNNPRDTNMTLGFLMPEKQGVFSQNGYVFNIRYEPMGYVKDDDAKDVDYDEMMAKLKEGADEENKSRIAAGYDAVNIIGWASKPYYDDKTNILYWAKEFKFGEDSVNTLNYNIRLLGRKGVLELNAIATMGQLGLVKADMPHVLNMVSFNRGYKYADYDSGVDKIAAWTIGGLVAGKILAKVGFFALILKFWKLLALGVVTAFSFIKKLFNRKKGTTESPENKEPIDEFETNEHEGKADTDKERDLVEQDTTHQPDEKKTIE